MDAFAGAGFDTQQPAVSGLPVPLILPCPSFGCGPAAGQGSTSVGLAGLTMSGVVPVYTPANGMRAYVIAGGGSAWFFQDNKGQNGIRFAVSPGVGVALPADGRTRTVLEARLQRFIDAPSIPTWALLLSVGMQWSSVKS